MTTSNEAPYGRRRRPLTYADSFLAPVSTQAERVLIPRGFETMEARFYLHAKQALRRSRVVKVIK